MPEPAQEPGEVDEALAWRSQLALQLARVLLVIMVAAALVVWLSMTHIEARNRLVLMALVAAGCVALPVVTGRPRGRARAWLVVVPSVLVAVAGYAQVGVLSGPGVALMSALMLTGLLLGRRVMMAVALVCAAAVGAIGWAMSTGRIPAPNPHDVSMLAPMTWIRTLSVTFFAIILFGWLMVAVVQRMERALLLAHQETLRRQQAERQRADAELMALESKQLEMVGRLAAGVAHDFNNNLTAIMGSAELLKLELPETGEHRELSDSILSASQRLAELTRQLLAYSRKARMLQAPTDLHVLVTEVVSLIRRSTDPNIVIETELSATNATVAADAALLQSAILNLLVNACDAMPQGGTLTVATTSVELTGNSAKGLPTGPCLLLEIMDTGRGIPEQQLPHIFDPFFTTKPVGKGTGLGLAAVAGTVKAHGGSIEVNSDVGHGTVFRLYLPSSEPEAQATLQPATTVVSGEGEILLVEDDAMVGMTAIATLESFGYTVTHASDGQSALEQARAHPGRFQLVLLDLRMPGLSGEATFEQLQELEPGLPVLLWSGYGAEQDVSSMLKKGAVGFVQKPYRVAELSRTVALSIRKVSVRSTA